MKKTLLIISLVTVCALHVNAQPNGFRMGVKLGPTIDWASPGSAVVKGEGVGLGFGMGLVFDQYLSDYFAVSSGVNFNLLRMKYSFMDRRLVDDFLEEANMTVSRRM